MPTRLFQFAGSPQASLPLVFEEPVSRAAESVSGDAMPPRLPVSRIASCPAHPGVPRFAPVRANWPLRIAVEGPLRAGKSTLARLLASRLGASFVAEPESNPFLARFYAGEPGMAFATQMWFLRERIAQLQAARSLAGPVVADYILEKDKLFAFLNLSDAELAIYKRAYAEHGELMRPDLVIYLQADPAVLTERRRRKGVPEERSIGTAYTVQVAEAYEHFFARYKASRLLVVDTSAIDFVHSEHEREMLLDRILAPVHGREYYAPLAHTA